RLRLQRDIRGGGVRAGRGPKTDARASHHELDRQLWTMSTSVTETTGRSHAIMDRARDLFPGGVSSPVRAFRGVGGEPFVVERGEGARIWDVDGREYIDYVLSWGALALRPP